MEKIIILCVLWASNERSEWAVNRNSQSCLVKLELPAELKV
jgi:hypothetical protein